MNLKMTRVRDTAATRSRVAAIKKIVANLADGPMTQGAIFQFLNSSPSGARMSASCARKYTSELRDAGIITSGPDVPTMPRIHTLNPDQAYVAAMLSAMYAPVTGRAPVNEQPGCHIHVMGDGAPYKIKSMNRIPEPCPVLAHFFGFAGCAA